MDKNRKTNFELLRIVSMIMIVILHYWGKSTYLDKVTIEMPGFYIGWLCKSICLCAVNCYVMLSGYFLMDKSFKPSRMFKIWAEVLFYSVTVYFFSSLIRNTNISLGGLIKSFLPVTTEAYWYVTVYLLLLVISPMLNFYIAKCNEKCLRNTCLSLTFIFSIIPTIFCYNDFTHTEYGYSILWFIVLYLIAAYIRKYGIKFFEKYNNSIICFVGSVIILFGSKIVIYTLSKAIFQEVKYTNILFTYNSLITLISSASLFHIFKNIYIKDEKLSRVILYISPSTFGVYLIHLHPEIKDWFWIDIVNPMKYDNWLILIGHFIATVISVYFFCTALDVIRIKTIEKPIIRLSRKIDEYYFKLCKK